MLVLVLVLVLLVVVVLLLLPLLLLIAILLLVLLLLLLLLLLRRLVVLLNICTSTAISATTSYQLPVWDGRAQMTAFLDASAAQERSPAQGSESAPELEASGRQITGEAVNTGLVPLRSPACMSCHIPQT